MSLNSSKIDHILSHQKLQEKEKKKNALSMHQPPLNPAHVASSFLIPRIYLLPQNLNPSSQLGVCNVSQTKKGSQRLYGSWAVITGATDGIGKAFAHQLAQKGLNLILVSRNPNKLKTVSSEILAEHPGTKIKTVVFDFSSKVSTRTVQGVIEKAVEGLNVGLLINNVGITYPAARFFHEVDEKVWMDIVRVNLEGTSRVTRAVLPGMIERKRGAIVNIGSGASSVLPSHPLFTIYSATKAYVDQLSRCLYVEYKRYGIHVQCQVPLYVATKMTSKVASIGRSSLFIPAPEDYAKSAIGRIGYEARCAPYWAHSFQWCFAWLLPECVLDAWRLSIGIH